MKTILEITPPKWTADWYPDEYKIRKYIFDTWRQVCVSYGFQEYLWPLVENVDIWKAKSWEDIAGSELTQITNRDGEISSLALRPEMTPTVTRMVVRKYKELIKPVKWFSIANFYRNEKPQKWRNREFWQLNVDMFWVKNIHSDIEILSLSLDIMKAFNAPVGSYVLRINQRELINIFFREVLEIFDDNMARDLMRLLDKYDKLSQIDFNQCLQDLHLSDKWESIEWFMKARNIADLEKSFPKIVNTSVFQEFQQTYSQLTWLFGSEVIEFSASLIRWFDYYDGIIFEIFDAKPSNPRSLFGWWRYNGLASIFGVSEKISAIWFAPWDETMKIFLEENNLLGRLSETPEKKYYLPLLEGQSFAQNQNIAGALREQWKIVLLWLTHQTLGRAKKYARKNTCWYLVIIDWNNWEYEIQNI